MRHVCTGIILVEAMHCASKLCLAVYRVIPTSLVMNNMRLWKGKQIVDTLPKTSIQSLNPL